MEIEETQDEEELKEELNVKEFSIKSTKEAELMKYYNKMTNLMYPIISDYDEVDRDIEMYDAVPIYDSQNYSDHMFDLTPVSGTLLPYECQIISISYKPDFNKYVNAIYNCHIDGGETKTLIVSGSCVKLSYTLDVDAIEFGLTVKISLKTRNSLTYPIFFSTVIRFNLPKFIYNNE